MGRANFVSTDMRSCGDPVIRPIDDRPIPTSIRTRRYRRHVGPRLPLGDRDRRLVTRQQQPRSEALLRRRAVGCRRADPPSYPRRRSAPLPCGPWPSEDGSRLQERMPKASSAHGITMPMPPSNQGGHKVERAIAAGIDRRRARTHDKVIQVSRGQAGFVPRNST
jgi:hypothetical protein